MGMMPMQMPKAVHQKGMLLLGIRCCLLHLAACPSAHPIPTCCDQLQQNLRLQARHVLLESTAYAAGITLHCERNSEPKQCNLVVSKLTTWD